MRYRDLKKERDDAIARAIEAERMSMKSEFERVEREFALERERLLEQSRQAVQQAYRNGWRDGVTASVGAVRAVRGKDDLALE